MKIKAWLTLTGVFSAMLAATAFGASDTSWYNTTDTEFELSTADELEGLAELVNSGQDNFADKTVRLVADVDLKGVGEWTPIGSTVENNFQGEFDGNRHKISNLTITKAKNCFNGLFGVVYGGKIMNLSLEDTNISINSLAFERDDTTPVMAGGFAALMCGGEIMICENLGGVVELNAAEITSNDSAAGIGAVTVPDESGWSASFRFCGNRANVGGKATCAGVVGNVNGGELSYCYNKGNIEAKGGARSAGLADVVSGGCYVSVCYNSGAVTSEGSMKSGICLMLDDTSTVTDCVDLYPNDSTIVVSGTISDVKSAGSVDIKKIGDTALAEKTETVDFTNMTLDEKVAAANNQYEYYVRPVYGENPVLWWEAISGSERIYGDVNGGGELTGGDAILMLRHISGLKALEGDALLAADVNRDGFVTLADVIALQNESRYYGDAYDNY